MKRRWSNPAALSLIPQKGNQFFTLVDIIKDYQPDAFVLETTLIL